MFAYAIKLEPDDNGALLSTSRFRSGNREPPLR